MFTTYDFWVLLIQEGVHGGEPWLLCAFIIYIYIGFWRVLFQLLLSLLCNYYQLLSIFPSLNNKNYQKLLITFP